MVVVGGGGAKKSKVADTVFPVLFFPSPKHRHQQQQQQQQKDPLLQQRFVLQHVQGLGIRRRVSSYSFIFLSFSSNFFRSRYYFSRFSFPPFFFALALYFSRFSFPPFFFSRFCSPSPHPTPPPPPPPPPKKRGYCTDYAQLCPGGLAGATTKCLKISTAFLGPDLPPGTPYPTSENCPLGASCPFVAQRKPATVSLVVSLLLRSFTLPCCARSF